MPDLGTLIGSRVSSDVFRSINDAGHKSFFGSDFDTMNNEFISRYVEPMDRINFQIGSTIAALINPDKWRPLVSIDDFRSIPPSMEYAIASFAPVRQGIAEGRMEGFGYDVNTFPEDDVYGRLIDNFTCRDIAAASDEAGFFDLKGHWMSDDPDISEDDLHTIEVTRDFILREILAKTNRDPTDIGFSRG
jgi:hypothetical protein